MERGGHGEDLPEHLDRERVRLRSVEPDQSDAVGTALDMHERFSHRCTVVDIRWRPFIVP